ncbi:MAG: hypothetical protein IJ797_04050 [Selenomonadaceae bacterium]|nr:hypothetical protein [Selenomonadaceae bacterium]
MLDYNYVTKEFIQTHEFIADEFTPEHQTQSFMLRPNIDKLPPTYEDLKIELRKKFSYIFSTKFNNSYVRVETSCQIKPSTLRKYFNGEREITIYAVAKFCIGAKLSIEKTYELFKLCGHILAPNDYLFDAIVIDAIKSEDNIYDFYDTCKRCNIGKKILDRLYHIK